MIERGESYPRPSAEGSVITDLMMSLDSSKLCYRPLFTQVREMGNGMKHNFTFDDAEAASRFAAETVELLNAAVNKEGLYGQPATVEAKEILIPVTERYSAGSDTVVISSRPMSPEESSEEGKLADKGFFAGFAMRAVESEENPGMYRPALCMLLARGKTHSPNFGPYLFSTAEVGRDTKIRFARDEPLAVIKNAVMALAGKDRSGRDTGAALADRTDLINLMRLLHFPDIRYYKPENLKEISDAVEKLLAGAYDDTDKNAVQRQVQQLLMAEFGLANPLGAILKSEAVLDKTVDFADGQFKDVFALQKAPSVVHGKIESVELLPAFDTSDGGATLEGEGVIPYFATEERVTEDKIVAEKERRLRFIPLNSISEITLP